MEAQKTPAAAAQPSQAQAPAVAPPEAPAPAEPHATRQAHTTHKPAKPAETVDRPKGAVAAIFASVVVVVALSVVAYFAYTKSK